MNKSANHAVTDLLQQKSFLLFFGQLICGAGPLDPCANDDTVVHFRRHFHL